MLRRLLQLYRSGAVRCVDGHVRADLGNRSVERISSGRGQFIVNIGVVMCRRRVGAGVDTATPASRAQHPEQCHYDGLAADTALMVIPGFESC